MNILNKIWTFLTVCSSSFIQGRELRTQMTLRLHGVEFDSNGNIVRH